MVLIILMTVIENRYYRVVENEISTFVPQYEILSYFYRMFRNALNHFLTAITFNFPLNDLKKIVPDLYWSLHPRCWDSKDLRHNKKNLSNHI